jgi:hypothetical protein
MPVPAPDQPPEKEMVAIREQSGWSFDNKVMSRAKCSMFLEVGKVC